MGFRRKIAIWVSRTLLHLTATGAPSRLGENRHASPARRFSKSPPARRNLQLWLERPRRCHGRDALREEWRSTSNCRVSDRPLAWFGPFGSSTFATAPWPIATTLRPITMHQVEEVRKKTVTTDVVFKPIRLNGSGLIPNQKSRLGRARIFSRAASSTCIRPCFTSAASRSATATSIESWFIRRPVPTWRRSQSRPASEITIAAGTYHAIKLDLQLSKIGKKRELEPHKKFRHASIWVSDDSDRLLLRVAASIFIGKVFAELQSVRFPETRQ